MSNGVLLSDIVKAKLEKGEHPKNIRKDLQAAGIRGFRYGFSCVDTTAKGFPIRKGVQAIRSCARRARQFKLCAGGCGAQGVTNTSGTCEACLEKKWTARYGEPSTRRSVAP